MLNIHCHEINANYNGFEIPSYIKQNGYHQENKGCINDSMSKVFVRHTCIPEFRFPMFT